MIVSIPLGVIAAWRFGGWFDRALMGFSVMGFSVPVFVLAYILIWIVSLKLGWLPVQGYVRIAESFFLFLKHLILPSITLSVIYIALIARVTRASVLEALGEDYIRTARAKGLPEMRVLVRHALANAAVPIATVIGIGIAILIGGVVVTESVYAIPGLGRLTVDAVLARDFPTMQGGDPVLLLRLRAGQPADRPVVRVPRPADPLLMILQQLVGAHRRSALLFLIVISIAAPWLGTVDPSLFDAASRDLRPGESGEITHPRGRHAEAHLPAWARTPSAATSTAACSTARACRCWSASPPRRSRSPSASCSACAPATCAGSTAR